MCFIPMLLQAHLKVVLVFIFPRTGVWQVERGQELKFHIFGSSAINDFEWGSGSVAFKIANKELLD